MGIFTALLSLPYRATQRVLGAMGYDLVVRSRGSQTRFREGLNLNVGAGHYHIPGFVSLDYISDYYHGGATSTAGVVHYDIRSDALPYGDETVSNVYASHVIEHVESEHVERFLVEAYRVLKPGGVLRIACPDARFLYEVSSFENDYWKWRRDQFEHDERYEVQGDITQSDFLTRELASVKMRHYRHAGDAVMPAFDVKEEDYASLLEAYRSGQSFNPEQPGEHINAWDMKRLHAIGVAAGFDHVIESKHRGSVSAAMQGPDMDQTQPQMSLYVEMIKG
ncbi:MAG: methyltransferase domain-containing protein [Candidatus Thermoplasmatota archaeon]|nr:methyltransferase domain-containing protein [Candidatus Thermoplasmatota archaeon]MEC8780349.1 methyltransferase domain-containing protein [Candidatus Thermoplasmatota archaeon]